MNYITNHHNIPSFGDFDPVWAWPPDLQQLLLTLPVADSDLNWKFDAVKDLEIHGHMWHMWMHAHGFPPKLEVAKIDLIVFVWLPPTSTQQAEDMLGIGIGIAWFAYHFGKSFTTTHYEPTETSTLVSQECPARRGRRTHSAFAETCSWSAERFGIAKGMIKYCTTDTLVLSHNICIQHTPCIFWSATWHI